MSDRHAARRSLGLPPATVDQPSPAAPVSRIGNSEEQIELLEMLGLPGETNSGQISDLLRQLRALPEHHRAEALEASGIIDRVGPTRLSVASLTSLILRLANATNANLMIRQLGTDDRPE